MSAYTLRLPPLILAGPGAAAQVPGAVARLGLRRLLFLSDGHLVESEGARTLRQALAAQGLEVAVFADVPGEPTTREVEGGLAALRAAGAEGVLAFGGGSVIDTAKAVAMMARNPGSIADYMGADRFVAGGLPVVAIATTAGTGSEVTRFTVITEPTGNVKMLIADDRLIPRVAVADPELTLAMPRRVTMATGLDALTHAIEAFVSRRANPTTDVLALAAAGEAYRALPRACRDGGDREARTAMMRASLHAGLAFSNASVALVHGMSRPLGAHFHVPHGLSNAMLLPVVMQYSLASAVGRYAALARAFGVEESGAGPERQAAAAVEAVQRLCRELGVPTLSQWGIGREALAARVEQMAQDALASGSPANNPRQPSAREIIDLYWQAF